MELQSKTYSAVLPHGSGLRGCLLTLKTATCKLLTTLCLLLLQTAPTYAQSHDTLRIFFELDKTYLTEQATHYIDSLIKTSTLERGKKIILQGYGDYLGSGDYNNNLSYMRAKSTQDYLVLAGYMQQDIKLIVGKGKITRTANGKGYPTDRKVEIIIDKRIDTPAREKLFYYISRLRENDETIPLKNIHFFRGSLRITPGSHDELQYLWEFMNVHNTWAIQLEGHICCLGPGRGKDEPYDESTLSQKRAETIRDSLVAHGVATGRILCVGLGNNDPLTADETPEDQELNRRVEVRVLKK